MGSLVEEEHHSRIAHLHALTPYSLLEEQRNTDLEMAMGSYSEGYRSGIEGGKAYDCIARLADGPTSSHTPPCDKSAPYEPGAYSTSSTFKMRWNSRRHDLLIDTACLLFGAIAGPPIQWVTIQSMHIGPLSLLDQKILQVLPISAKLVASLEPHQNVAMALMVSTTSMSVALLCKAAATTTGSGRSAVSICFCLVLMIGASVWNHIGGSAALFFPVFLPVATTVAASLGLLWQRH